MLDAIEGLQTEPPASVAWLAVAGPSETLPREAGMRMGCCRAGGVSGSVPGVWLQHFLVLRSLSVPSFRGRTMALVPFVPPIRTFVTPCDDFEGGAVNLVTETAIVGCGRAPWLQRLYRPAAVPPMGCRPAASDRRRAQDGVWDLTAMSTREPYPSQYGRYSSVIRVFGFQTSVPDLKFAAWQAIIFFIAFVIPVLVHAMSDHASDHFAIDTVDLAANGALFAALLSTTLFAFGLDSRTLTAREGVLPFRLGLALLAGGCLIILAFRSLPFLSASPGLLPVSLALAFGGILGTRRLFCWFLRLGEHARRVIIVGAGESARKVHDLMARSTPTRYDVLGYYQPGSFSPGFRFNTKELLDTTRSLAALACEHHVDEIVVALDDRRGALPIDDLLKAKLNGTEVTDLVAFYERECSTIKFEQMQPSWIVFSSDFRLGPGRRIAKRAFDLTAALVVLLATAPLLLIVALASLVESRGREPVLYHQDRVGQGGRIFRLHKFRSMAVNAESDGQARWARADDNRVTPLGRTLRRYRLDELPQLFNVLAGEMSLVGPRPERPEFVVGLTKTIPYYGERHCVKPGLAGWAQLMYPYGASIEDAKRKLEYDLYYIKHTGVLWDLVILMRTVEVVLLGKGVR